MDVPSIIDSHAHDCLASQEWLQLISFRRLALRVSMSTLGGSSFAKKRTGEEFSGCTTKPGDLTWTHLYFPALDTDCRDLSVGTEGSESVLRLSCIIGDSADRWSLPCLEDLYVRYGEALCDLC